MPIDSGSSIGGPEQLALALLALLVVVVVFANSWGRFVPDTKPETYFAPGRTLVNSLHVWLPSIGQAGQPSYNTGQAPVVAFIWVLRSVGLSPWVAMRVWRVILYLVAGWGIRRWFDEVTAGETNRTGRLAVMVFYVANPFVVVSGSATPLMLPYAVLPWMLFAQIRSIGDPRSWRRAALFALAFAAMSGANAGVVPLFLLVAVPCQLLAARLTKGTSWRDLWASLWRCGAFSFGLSLYWIVPSVVAAGTGATIAAATEKPRIVAQASSWAEVGRLLGTWPLYGREGTRPFSPQYLSYLTNPFVAAAAYAVPVIAALGAWFARSRAKLTAGLLLAVGLPVMVGQFPGTRQPLWGRLLGAAFADIPSAVAFRTTIKAGPLVALAYALCIGIGAVAVARRWGKWPAPWRRATVAGAAGMLVLSVLPAVTGRLWPTAWNVPGYWRAAAAELNAGAARSRVLVVPGGAGGNYRWGMRSPDDILPSLLRRSTASHSTVAGPADRAANFMAGWDMPLNEDTLPAGALSVIARYVGASDVLVRNDTRYEEIRGAPPSVVHAEVTADEGLSLQREYGRVGEFTTPGANLSPLERYRVAGGAQSVRTEPASGTVLIDGDGFAIPTLASLGLLDGSQPFRWMGDITDNELRSAASAGTRVVITDTNRRRSWGANRVGYAFGPTLAASSPIDDSGAPSLTLFPDRIATQTVTRVDDVAGVTGTPALFGPEPGGGPEHAFDGDPFTLWMTGGFGATGSKVTVNFGRPVAISEVFVSPALTSPARVTRVSVHVGKRSVPSALGFDFTTAVAVPRTTARSLTVEITGVSAGLNQVGLAEVGIPGVGLSQPTVLPRAFSALAARADRPTRDRLARAPIDVVMTRQRAGLAGAPLDEERAIDREFTLPQARQFSASATLHSLQDLPGTLESSVLSTPDGTPAPCFSIGHLDGADLLMRVAVPLSKITSGDDVPLRSCDDSPVSVAEGGHRLRTLPDVLIDQIWLSSVGEMRQVSKPPQARVISSGATRTTLTLPAATAPYYLLTGQSDSPGWRATLDGHDLGPSMPLDGLTAGWRINRLGEHRAVLTYQPQQAATLAFFMSFGVALAAGVIVARPIWRRRRGRRVTR